MLKGTQYKVIKTDQQLIKKKNHIQNQIYKVIKSAHYFSYVNALAYYRNSD